METLVPRWRIGLDAASRQGCQSHLLVQPQELAVAHPTVQDSIHVNVYHMIHMNQKLRMP